MSHVLTLNLRRNSCYLDHKSIYPSIYLLIRFKPQISVKIENENILSTSSYKTIIHAAMFFAYPFWLIKGRIPVLLRGIKQI